jgi:hypothetical protein
MKMRKTRDRVGRACLAAALLLTGCQNRARDDAPRSGVVGEAAPPEFRFCVVKVDSAPYYKIAPGQATGPDGRLAGGTRLEVIDVGKRFCQVKLDEAQTAYVARKHLTPEEGEPPVAAPGAETSVDAAQPKPKPKVERRSTPARAKEAAQPKAAPKPEPKAEPKPKSATLEPAAPKPAAAAPAPAKPVEPSPAPKSAPDPLVPQFRG